MRCPACTAQIIEESPCGKAPQLFYIHTEITRHAAEGPAIAPVGRSGQGRRPPYCAPEAQGSCHAPQHPERSRSGEGPQDCRDRNTGRARTEVNPAGRYKKHPEYLYSTRLAATGKTDAKDRAKVPGGMEYRRSPQGRPVSQKRRASPRKGDGIKKRK